MSLKNLYQFARFDLKAFLEGKTLKLVDLATWEDYNTGEILGTRAEVVIAADRTNYTIPKGRDRVRSNLYEKMTIKVRKDIQLPLDTVVTPVNAVAKVYGDRNDCLSIVAADLVPAKKGDNNA